MTCVHRVSIRALKVPKNCENVRSYRSEHEMYPYKNRPFPTFRPEFRPFPTFCLGPICVTQRYWKSVELAKIRRFICETLKPFFSKQARDSYYHGILAATE